MRNRTNELTFSDAVRIYQADRRDRDFGYMYPVEECASIHGSGRKRYWVLRDNYGLISCVMMNGKILLMSTKINLQKDVANLLMNYLQSI